MLAFLVLFLTIFVWMPRTLSSWPNAIAAGSSAARVSGSKCISTLAADTFPARGLEVPLSFIAGMPPTEITPHCCWSQPAFASISSISQQRSACSPSPPPKPISNLVCGNAFSCWAIRSVCGLSLARLGVLNSIKSVSALAARSSAVATFSSDRRLNSLWRRPAICPSLISVATPIAIRPLARDDPHCSQNESYGGWHAAMITSAITPTTTKPPPNHSQRSHDSMDFSSSESLAFLVPFGRRHAGKEFEGFWIGVGVGALIFVALFAIHWLQ